MVHIMDNKLPFDLPWKSICGKKEWMPPQNILDDILTPHEHEGEEHNKPCWMVWIRGPITSGVWVPNCICSTDESALYHYYLATENERREDYVSIKKFSWIIDVRIERVPMDHAFGSDMLKEAVDHNRKHFIDWAKRTATKKPEKLGIKAQRWEPQVATAGEGSTVIQIQGDNKVVT